MTIQEARDQKKLVKIETKEDYEYMVPILSQIYKGWYKEKFADFESRGMPFYISAYYDSLTRDLNKDDKERIISVNAFKTDQVIENYPIY